MEHLCEYGCGNLGIIKNKSNTGWRCSPSPNSCPGVKSRKKQKLLDTYGVTNVSQIPEVNTRRKETWIEKYGVDNPAKAQINKEKIKAAWPETQRKRTNTMLKKYGFESYSSTQEFNTRRKETWIEKYGVDNPVKNKDILHKVMISNSNSQYLTKSMTLPSGKVIRYQGFENKVILELLKSGLKEDDIITGPGNVPRIPYTFNGCQHVYYPDIYIPKFNQLIEVKSKYTWKKYKEKNLAKRQACKDAGFTINIAIR